jgi:copper transport protein
MTSDLFMLQVEVDPAKVGTNLLHLYAFTPDGNAPGAVQEWVIKAALPAKGIDPITATVVPFTLDHAQGEINLPSAGTWHFTFTLRVSEIDQRTVAADIPIR